MCIRDRSSGHRFLLKPTLLPSAFSSSVGNTRLERRTTAPGMGVASSIAMRCGGLINELLKCSNFVQVCAWLLSLPACIRAFTALMLRGEQWLYGVWCNHYSVNLVNATTKLDCIRAVLLLRCPERRTAACRPTRHVSLPSHTTRHSQPGLPLSLIHI